MVFSLRANLQGCVFICKRNDIVSCSPPVYTEKIEKDMGNPIVEHQSTTILKRHVLKTHPCKPGFR